MKTQMTIKYNTNRSTVYQPLVNLLSTKPILSDATETQEETLSFPFFCKLRICFRRFLINWKTLATPITQHNPNECGAESTTDMLDPIYSKKTSTAATKMAYWGHELERAVAFYDTQAERSRTSILTDEVVASIIEATDRRLLDFCFWALTEKVFTVNPTSQQCVGLAKALKIYEAKATKKIARKLKRA